MVSVNCRDFSSAPGSTCRHPRKKIPGAEWPRGGRPRLAVPSRGAWPPPRPGKDSLAIAPSANRILKNCTIPAGEPCPARPEVSSLPHHSASTAFPSTASFIPVPAPGTRYRGRAGSGSAAGRRRGSPPHAPLSGCSARPWLSPGRSAGSARPHLRPDCRGGR